MEVYKVNPSYSDKVLKIIPMRLDLTKEDWEQLLKGKNEIDYLYCKYIDTEDVGDTVGIIINLLDDIITKTEEDYHEE